MTSCPLNWQQQFLSPLVRQPQVNEAPKHKRHRRHAERQQGSCHDRTANRRGSGCPLVDLFPADAADAPRIVEHLGPVDSRGNAVRNWSAVRARGRFSELLKARRKHPPRRLQLPTSCVDFLRASERNFGRCKGRTHKKLGGKGPVFDDLIFSVDRPLFSPSVI